MQFNYLYYFSLIAPILHLLFYQSYKFNKDVGIDCLKKFKSNNFLGFIVLISLLIGKIL